MKITIETEHEKCTVESDGETFGDLYELFKQCALGVGFHWNTVTQYDEENIS